MARRTVLIVGMSLVVLGLGWWVVQVTMLDSPARDDASGYGQFVLAVAGIGITMWQVVDARASASRTMSGADDLDRLTDQLAVAARTQWTTAAADRGLLQPAPLPIRWRRCTSSVAGPITAATSRLHTGLFTPLPHLDRVTSGHLREGTHRMLHRIYGGLPSGRLIITGGPGVGKSSAAILLLLDALDFRDHTPPDHRARVPVPVLFTLQGWDPDTTPVHDWLATKLTELPPLIRRGGHTQAMQLLTTGRVAVFLDGLDEIPEPQRPSALHALAQQATFRLVLLTRTHELAIAAEHHVLTGAAALELQPLTPDDAATYLQHNLPDPPPEPWQRLLDVLTQDTDTPLTQTLNNPLTITLLRDTYQPPPTPNSAIGTIDDLIDTSRFPTSDHITNHLLDHAITTAYMPRPGQPLPPYTPQTAHRTLTVIAQHLRAHQTHDLAWWRIPTWVPRTPRTLLIVVITGLLIGLVVGLPLGLSTGLVGGLGGGLLAGLIRGLPKKLVVSTEPHRLGRFQRKRAVWGALSNGLVFGLVGRLVFGLMGGLVFGLVGGVGGVLLEGFRANATGTITQPNDLRRGEIVYWLALGLVLGGGGGLSSALLSGAGHGMEALVIGVAVAPVVGLVVGVTLSVTWLVAVSQIYLTIRYHTPMRLARFLTDAHNRHLLRTVGPIYQFRHATLQERLAPPMVAAK